MSTITIPQLTKGNHYLVQTEKKPVRRIFKTTEKRFGDILCFVFTSQVTKSVKCEVDESENQITYKYSGAKKYPAQEISIPFYNIKSIKIAD